MKSLAITIAKGNSIALDAHIQKAREELLALASKNARHFAAKNQPSPIGDKLIYYVEIFKTTCENQYARFCVLLNPASNFPGAKMAHDYYSDNRNELSAEIDQLINQNLNDKHDLGNYNPNGIPQRLRIAGGVTALILLGEILFNMKAFQLTGENFLFSFIISITVSIGVFIAAHGVPLLYKKAETRGKKWIIVCSTLLIMTAVFTALAYLRSLYYSAQQFEVSPIYFIVINLFLFMVSALLSFFIVPSLATLKENSLLLQKHRAIEKRAKVIEEKKAILTSTKRDHMADTTERMETVFVSNYSAEAMRKLYAESVAHFKSENLCYRSDRQTPSCFSDPLPPLDIQETTIHQFNSNRKIS